MFDHLEPLLTTPRSKGAGLVLNAQLVDPTRTTTLRNQFMGEVGRRFRKLKGRILEEVVEQDGFGLKGLKTNRGRFEFTRSDRKVEAFMEWLREAAREEILDVRVGVPISRAASSAWTSVYIESAHQKGIAQAAQRMRAAGATVAEEWVTAAFNRPIHADRLGLIYTRVFTELVGITEAMDQQISRELVRGIAEGRNPLEIARSLNNRVDKIGRTRARTLARTEVVATHAEASLNSYEEAGVQGVQVMAEFSTAGDSLVCPFCEELEGDVYTMADARGIIPVHPNCRCVWIPALDDLDGTVLR